MSTQDSVAGYAYWISQDGSKKIIYSLAMMSEIDAVVNEGFRRIPHGGVESGGFLFGTRNGNEVRVEAFRPIDCQHAFGPSFVLSERDLEGMRNQLRNAVLDGDLTGLRPLGWMLGHTRSQLQISERELGWFDEFFPEPGSITLLVKPERFQATRFVFLVRDEARRMARDEAGSNFILPLSGQASGPNQRPAPSIPAPQQPATQTVAEPEDTNAKPPADEAAPVAVDEGSPGGEETDAAVIPESAAPPVVVPPEAEIPKPLGGQVTRVRTPSPETPAPPSPAAPLSGPPSSGPQWPGPSSAPTRPLSPFGPAPESPAAAGRFPSGNLPSSASSQTTASGDAKLAYPYASLASSRPRAPQKSTETFGLRSAAVLVLAALLGCLAGYWAYLQLPSPVIPVSVREQRGEFIVEWPAAQTNDVDYAALQVNDGQWVTLSPEQKTAGRAVITPPPTGDLKIDLLAKHWLRDSRGIVRYIRTAH